MSQAHRTGRKLSLGYHGEQKCRVSSIRFFESSFCSTIFESSRGSSEVAGAHPIMPSRCRLRTEEQYCRRCTHMGLSCMSRIQSRAGTCVLFPTIREVKILTHRAKTSVSKSLPPCSINEGNQSGYKRTARLFVPQRAYTAVLMSTLLRGQLFFFGRPINIRTDPCVALGAALCAPAPVSPILRLPLWSSVYLR